MKTQRTRVFFTAGFLAALALGWTLGAVPARSTPIGGSDRWNDRVVLTGAISREQDRKGAYHDVEALYVLNYSNGLLLAAVPMIETTTTGSKAFSDFAERDLVSDFGIQPGTNAHFLMTTLSCGNKTEGWAPLLVIETETGQVATYKVQPQSVAGSSRPSFLLLERRTDPRLAKAMAGASTR